MVKLKGGRDDLFKMYWVDDNGDKCWVQVTSHHGDGSDESHRCNLMTGESIMKADC